MFESPLNRTVQTVELPGARWILNFEWRSISHADARLIKVFLAKLRGMSGSFYAYDYAHQIPSGTANSSACLVKGANQTGTSLATDGWTANQSSLFLPGDYFGVNNELKLVTSVCASNASGESTLIFEPPLRSSPADNAVITYNKPTAIFRLKDDEQDQIEIDPERRPSCKIEAYERFL